MQDMAKNLPFVSVVVPAYNEELMLPTCLQSLVEQKYDGKYEIIVVDNMSDDLTPQLARVYGVTVIKEKKRGVACARQAGFLKAKGKIILSTDADTILPPDWIERMVREITKSDEIVAVGGYCDLIGVNTPLKLISSSLMPLIFILDKILDYPGTTQGWNFGVKKDAFMKAGGFDITLKPGDIGEDRDLGKRLRKIGKVKVLYRLKVKTSARRFVGFVKTIKYVFVNYLFILLNKRAIPGSFQIIRQKPYESYDVVNDKPFFLTLVVSSLAALVFLAGAIPTVNLWSVSSVKTQEKVIALTFDDVPSGQYTTELLGVLRQKNVKATFFVTGESAKSHPEIVRAIYLAGNVIGNYSLTDKTLTMLKSPSAIIKDINLANELIYNDIGVKPKFFRPPHGYRSIWGALSLDKHGYDIVTWNNSTDSWLGKETSKKIAVDIIKDAKPGDIIDLQAKDQTIKATEEIIDLLQADGYRFVTLDTLLNKPAYY